MWNLGACIGLCNQGSSTDIKCPNVNGAHLTWTRKSWSNWKLWDFTLRSSQTSSANTGTTSAVEPTTTPPLLLCQHRPWLVSSSSNSVRYFQLLSSKYRIRHWNFLSFWHSINAREYQSNQWWIGIWINISKQYVAILPTHSISKHVNNDRSHTGSK